MGRIKGKRKVFTTDRADEERLSLRSGASERSREVYPQITRINTDVGEQFLIDGQKLRIEPRRMRNFQISDLPKYVSLYFCKRLLGLSGIVLSIYFASNAGLR